MFESNGNIFDYYEKLVPMSGEQIAQELNTTRQNISSVLKRTMTKIYNRVQRENLEMSPFEVVVYISEILGVNQRGEQEISKFFKLFPPEIRQQIIEDGQNKIRTRNGE